MVRSVGAGTDQAVLFIIDHWDLTGLGHEELLNRVVGMPKLKCRKLAEALYSTVNNRGLPSWQQNTEIFHFFAGSVIRGDSICAALGCQNGKLAVLGRFAALYADSVVFPLQVSNFDASSHSDRLTLAHNINAVLKLRPLIESGIVRLTPTSSCMCSECLMVRGIDVKKLTQSSLDFWHTRMKEFEVVYRGTNPEIPPFLEIQGPPEFLPHLMIFPEADSLGLSFGKKPSLIRGEPGIAISQHQLKRSKMIPRFFGSFTQDLLLQQIYGFSLGTTYLTDSVGQSQYFEQLAGAPRDGRPSEAHMNAARLMTSLGHNVPLFSNAPLTKLLELRASEQDAFIRYRATINEIVRRKSSDNVGLSDRQLAEIYADEVAPRIAEMNDVSKSVLRKDLKKLSLKAIGTSVAVTIGLLAGILPSELKPLLIAAGGAGLVKDFIDILGNRQIVSEELRGNNLYFLLKLNNLR